jgi:hypothetical protein
MRIVNKSCCTAIQGRRTSRGHKTSSAEKYRNSLEQARSREHDTHSENAEKSSLTNPKSHQIFCKTKQNKTETFLNTIGSS